MPTFQPETLRQIGYQLFEAAGCKPEDTRAVVDHLIESNLFGHDSTAQSDFTSMRVLSATAGFSPVRNLKL